AEFPMAVLRGMGLVVNTFNRVHAGLQMVGSGCKKAPVLGTGHQSTLCIILHIFCKINKFMHFVAN
ncbi:MAG: hypothetical protein ACO24U_10095, partial [Prochlorococcaceae cyanobacterium]